MKRQNAYFQALKEAEQTKEEKEEQTVQTLPSPPVTRIKPDDKRRFKKTTCYFSEAQLSKFDDISYGIKRKTGKKVSLPDIARFLIETCNSEDIIDRLTVRR